MVKCRNVHGNLIGTRNDNLILDTRTYVYEMPDRTRGKIAANVIAENMYSQVDEQGRSFAILKEIVDHQKDGHALTKENAYFIRNGRRTPKLLTTGWQLQVLWHDGSTSWVPLKDMKVSNPVEVAEYAVVNQIADELAFMWWAREVLRRCAKIVQSLVCEHITLGPVASLCRW